MRRVPNREQSISISFLINVISPLFNHIAYRHVLESQLEKKKEKKKQLEIQSGVCFDITLCMMTLLKSLPVKARSNYYFEFIMR